VSNFYR